MTELEKMTQAETYINRYFEFEDGVTISEENKEYLKTYIKDLNKIEAEFDIKKKTMKSIAIAVGISLVVFLLLMIPLHNIIIVPIIIGGFMLIAGIILVVTLNKYKLTAAREHQKEVNEGIAEQIEILDLRIKQLEQQRDDYFTALQKRIDFMELDVDYMKNIDKIKKNLEDGTAETCEEAVDIYEQSMLMAQMSDIMSKSERKPEMDMEKNMERFGDPLKIIKENKKKRRAEKKEKKKKK